MTSNPLWSKLENSDYIFVLLSKSCDWPPRQITGRPVILLTHYPSIHPLKPRNHAIEVEGYRFCKIGYVPDFLYPKVDAFLDGALQVTHLAEVESTLFHNCSWPPHATFRAWTPISRSQIQDTTPCRPWSCMLKKQECSHELSWSRIGPSFHTPSSTHLLGCRQVSFISISLTPLEHYW